MESRSSKGSPNGGPTIWCGLSFLTAAYTAVVPGSGPKTCDAGQFRAVAARERPTRAPAIRSMRAWRPPAKTARQGASHLSDHGVLPYWHVSYGGTETSRNRAGPRASPSGGTCGGQVVSSRAYRLAVLKLGMHLFQLPDFSRPCSSYAYQVTLTWARGRRSPVDAGYSCCVQSERGAYSRSLRHIDASHEG